MGLSEVYDTLTGSKTSRMGVAAAFGAAIGMVVSFTVNCTLVEISINGFFAVYFGVLFILIASLILWRVKTGDHPKPWLLIAFSGLVLMSGLLCFVLEKNWFMSMAPGWKVPLYSMLGIAVTFALLFSIIDLINYCCGLCQGDDSKPLVETESQVYLVVATAVVMGFVFGLIFGLLDIEDEKLTHLRIALMREQSICYPIGAVLGAISAALNQWFREQPEQYRFDPVHDDELDDDF
eukprot:TRINITY_DN809_c0_g1_i1.p2 TRINITY_DN809_c0_g1~~TRINITY_DN809_c0_g1_i1.p2  ORF type:complete len:258 (-),score=130.22 TRINITY_DN809_c0_g1_i1:84-791(-)